MLALGVLDLALLFWILNSWATLDNTALPIAANSAVAAGSIALGTGDKPPPLSLGVSLKMTARKVVSR